MSDNEKEERRKHPRYSHKTRVWLEKAPGEEMEELITLDISAGGLRLELGEKPDLGENLLLFFEIPLLPDPVKAVCSVARVDDLEGGKRYAVGTELIAVEGIAEDQLMRFLKEVFA